MRVAPVGPGDLLAPGRECTFHWAVACSPNDSTIEQLTLTGSLLLEVLSIQYQVQGMLQVV